MFGLLLALGFAWALGAMLSYPLGLGHLGRYWHLGFGIAGTALGWLFVFLLRVPYWLRISVNGIDILPVWTAVGTAMVVLVAALVVSGGERDG